MSKHTRGAALAAMVVALTACAPDRPPPATARSSAGAAAQASRELLRCATPDAGRAEVVELLEKAASAATSELWKTVEISARMHGRAAPVRAKTPAPQKEPAIARGENPPPTPAQSSLELEPGGATPAAPNAATPPVPVPAASTRPARLERSEPPQVRPFVMPTSAKIAAGVGGLGVAVGLATIPAASVGTPSATTFSGVAFGVGALGLATAAVITLVDRADGARVQVGAGPANVMLHGRF